MKKHERSKSALFLTEFIIMLLVLSVVSVITLQLFVKSHELSRDAFNLNEAVIRARSAAEITEACAGEEAVMREYFSGSGGEYAAYYDGDWNETEEKSDRSVIVLTEWDGGMLRVKVSVNDSGEVIYAISTCVYVGEQNGV